MAKISFKLVENDFELDEAFRVRQTVFVEEQGVNEDIGFNLKLMLCYSRQYYSDGGII